MLNHCLQRRVNSGTATVLCPAVMFRVSDQLQHLAQSCLVFGAAVLPSDDFAAFTRALDMEFIKSGLGPAQLKLDEATSKTPPRRTLASVDSSFIAVLFPFEGCWENSLPVI